MDHIVKGTSAYIAGRLSTRRPVRLWFDNLGRIAGEWTAKNGRRYVIAHDAIGRTIVRSSARQEPKNVAH